MALAWLAAPKQVALWWLWGRIEVALGCLLVAYRLPTKWLCGGFEMASDGFGVTFCIRHSTFFLSPSGQFWWGSAIPSQMHYPRSIDDVI
jgi:hypothetical protein